MAANPPVSTVPSTAYEASHVLKATPGTLVSLTGYNSLGSAQWIQIHNAASLPADTAAPLLTQTVPASSNFSINLPSPGLPCSIGIVVCNSTTGPDKHIGAANCYFTGVIA